MNKVLFSIGPINIYWYSFLIVAALIIGISMAIKEAKRTGFETSYMSDLCFYCIIWAIIGARLYYVLFKWQDYQNNFLDIFKIWEGGIAIYGAIIAGIICTIVYAKKKKYPIMKTLDIMVPSVILGQAIGRWGNFFNQEAFGPATTRAFLESLPIPEFVIEGMNINGIYHEPTFLYESCWCLLGFLILILLRYCVKNLKCGTLTGFYFIWYGIGRWIIEGMRMDSLYLGNIRISQFVSILLIITGMILWIRSFIKKESYRNQKKLVEEKVCR